MKTSRAKRRGIAKYPQVKEAILREIDAGRYPPGGRLPTESEFAARLKVTAPTVSRALNELESSGRIVRRRGSGSYVADPRKRQVLPGRSLRVGILFPNTIGPGTLYAGGLPGQIVQGVLHELGLQDAAPHCPEVRDDEDSRIVFKPKDCNVTVECLGEANTSHGRHPSLAAVRAGGFDALVCAGVVEDTWLKALLALGVPTVLADYGVADPEPGADVVFLDPASGYRRAARAFAALGLKRIHFLGAVMSAGTPIEHMPQEVYKRDWSDHTRVDPDSYLRLNAFRQGMDECGLEVPAEAVHFERNGEPFTGALCERLAALPEAQRPEAVVAHGLEQAESLIACFARHGLKLHGAGTTTAPKDSHALGILADGKAVGSVATELLISRLARPHRPLLRVGVKMPFLGSDYSAAPVRLEAARDSST